MSWIGHPAATHWRTRRVAPGRAAPSRKRRPPRRSGGAPTTPARPRRPQHPAHAIIARATSEMPQTKDSHPERRRSSHTCSCRRKVGICRLSSPAHANMSAEVRVRAGPFASTRCVRRSMPQGMRDRARHQPRSSYGALRGVPAEGVARDAKRLALRGRLSPPESARKRGSTINLDHVVIMWRSTRPPEGVVMLAKFLRNMVPATRFELVTP
jgi:hypothetical protein